MWGYGMMGYGMAGAMFLWWAILLCGIILAGYGAIKLLRNKKGTSNNALEQLRMRLAMGEICQEEFMETKQLLQE